MQLIWFKQDLRIQDHTALWHATQAGQSIGLVFLSPQQWQLHDDAPIKVDFYLRQLQQLKKQLEQLNIPLIVETTPLWVDIPHALLNICQKFNIEQVHSHIEAGVHEQQRDQNTSDLLRKHAIGFEQYTDRTLFPFASIRNQSGTPYQVFGAFKKQCYERLNMGLTTCYDTPEKQTEIQHAELNNFSTEVPSYEILYSNVTVKSNPQTSHDSSAWQVGESFALQQLDAFIEDRLAYYKTERDLPQLNGTSQLSAYLNIGILSIRQCLQALFREQHGHFHIAHEGQNTWLDELLWREFYQHILYDYPQVSKHQPFKEKTQNIPWRENADDLNAWRMGQTGIPIVDAGIRQMRTTGWMHNRVRMIVAMFLSKNLLIDWRLGEQWFMQHLIDGDLAANNGGWQWCASTGTDAVPYFRIFNPVSQSQKFDPNGDYIRTWVPELAHLDAKHIHEPYATLKSVKLKSEKPHISTLNYPNAIVDLKQSRIRAIETFKSHI